MPNFPPLCLQGLGMSVIVSLVTFLSIVLLASQCSATVPDPYTNVWVVEIEGGSRVAKKLARSFGFEYHGQV